MLPTETIGVTCSSPCGSMSGIPLSYSPVHSSCRTSVGPRPVGPQGHRTSSKAVVSGACSSFEDTFQLSLLSFVLGRRSEGKGIQQKPRDRGPPDRKRGLGAPERALGFLCCARACCQPAADVWGGYGQHGELGLFGRFREIPKSDSIRANDPF